MNASTRTLLCLAPALGCVTSRGATAPAQLEPATPPSSQPAATREELVLLDVRMAVVDLTAMRHLALRHAAVTQAARRHDAPVLVGPCLQERNGESRKSG